MAVKIGSARNGENGNAHGGKAGDQTGREVSVQNWYLHKKGWRVFRCKDPAKAELMAQNMQAACDNPNIGYDQWQRHTLYKAAKLVGFILSRVKTKCETDCSALIRVLLALIGVSVPEEFRTGNMPGYLLKSGMFVELTGDKYQAKSAYLRRGDILVTKTAGHTVMVLTDGSKAEKNVPPVASSSQGTGGASGGDGQGKTVRVTGGSVNVRSAPGTTGTRILGIVRKGDRLEYQGQSAEINGTLWYLVVYKGQNAWISGKYSETQASGAGAEAGGEGI